MGDDIDSMLGEEEKQIEVEEFKEEREQQRANKNKGKPLKSAPLGMDDDDDDVVGMGDLTPAELGSIDHHAEEVRMIEEKITMPLGTSVANKKKIPGTPSTKQRQSKAVSPATNPKSQSSTKKQKERYSKE